jgi:hypothetical protein
LTTEDDFEKEYEEF